MTRTAKWPPSEKYTAASAAIGAPAGEWINHLRLSDPRPSWQRISRLLYMESGIEVSHESLRDWHTKWAKMNEVTS